MSSKKEDNTQCKYYYQDGSLGTFEVPIDYEQDALEQSVTAAVERLSAAAELVDMVEQVTEEYRRSDRSRYPSDNLP